MTAAASLSPVSLTAFTHQVTVVPAPEQRFEAAGITPTDHRRESVVP